MADFGYALAGSIDAEALREAYAAAGRVQISPFLDADGAARLRDHLLAREDWRLKLRSGSKVLDLSPDTLAGMSPPQRSALTRIAAPARDSIGYLYDHIPAAGDEGVVDSGTPLGAFAGFLSSASVIALLRSVAGAPDIDFADGQATRYAPGHFLTLHHDEVEGRRRRAAYVFGLTPEWHADWGGLLLFHDRRGDLTAGLVPRMNVLTLFAVPQPHSVSLVAPFAGASRYSVTGWLRSRPPGGAR